MALETLHDRGFYEEIAGQHRMLDEVIKGKTTLYDSLEGIMGQLEKKWTALDDFKIYLTLAAKLGAGLDGEEQEKRAHSLNWGFFYNYVYKSMALLTGLNVFCLVVAPPLTLLEPLYVGAGAWVCKKVRPHKKFYDDTKKRKDEIFAPVYEAATMLDADLSRCFILNHFHNARPRFEQTYRSLSGDEREAVDAQLNSYLGAGGIPGMDELQLKDYLAGLLAPQVEGDA